jgi:hypothetical protein
MEVRFQINNTIRRFVLCTAGGHVAATAGVVSYLSSSQNGLLRPITDHR